MRPSLLSAALAAALVPPAYAEPAPAPAPAPEPATELDRVVVTATRTERAAGEVAASVDVIDRERMDRELVRTLEDLFRYEPGISVRSSFGRFGIGDIRIRGLDGNRVRIETDGIGAPDAFSIGSFSNANRNFTDLDTLKRVEVVRGPGSALYGSDALGGVVAFVTKDPSDYLSPGSDTHFGFKLGYTGDNDGLFGSATTAVGGERWSGLLVVGHRQGRELATGGDRDIDGALRTAPNPQRTDGRSVLAKLVHDPDPRQRWRLTVEGTEDAAETDVRSARGPQMGGSMRVEDLRGDDHQSRARVSLAHEWDAQRRALDRLQWQVYRQDSRTRQRTRESRTSVRPGSPPSRALRLREFDFDQRLVGLEAVAHAAFSGNRIEHAVTYGLEWNRTDTRQKRDGLSIDPATGIGTPVVPPDVFPVRDFPISRTTSAAVFVQDEMRMLDGRLRLVPALRVDRYTLDPRRDAIFDADNPGVEVQGLRATSVAPKLGVVWKPGGAWSVFGQYARGFRAPPANDVNLGFTNLQFGYTAIPNPDLQPETSDGYEVGLRFAGEAAFASLGAYVNRYRDFIESLQVVSAPPQSPLLVFQSRNVARAEIRGVEFAGGVELDAWSPRLAGWRLRGSAAWSEGDDLTADEPLASIDPARATLGLSYERTDWGVELAGRFAERKRRVPAPASGQRPYAPAGYGVLDLLAHWRFAPGARLDAGVFNLADRRYVDWADLGGVAADSPVVQRYTRPGRSVSLSLAFEW